MELFKMGVKDYTQFIQVPTYKINSLPVYDEWEDADRVKHRDIIRYRLQGTLTIAFQTAEEYFAFLLDYESNSDSGGATIVTLYANNKNLQYTTKAYLSFDPDNTLPLLGRAQYSGFSVSIEEV